MANLHTLNYQMQKEAEAALINGIDAAKGKGVTQGALVCVEPKNRFYSGDGRRL